MSIMKCLKFTVNSCFCTLQFCNEYAVPRDKIEHFKDVTAHDIVCSQVANIWYSLFLGVVSSSMVIIIILQKSSSERLNEEDVSVSNVRIDLTRGRHNPLERFVKMGDPIQFLLFHEFSLSFSSSFIIILSLSILLFFVYWLDIDPLPESIFSRYRLWLL